MVDSGSSVSLVDKPYLPSGCVILRRQQALRTADGHGMRIVGMVRLTVHLGAFKAEQELLVAEQLLMPVILGVDFLSKHSQWSLIAAYHMCESEQWSSIQLAGRTRSTVAMLS